MSDEAREIIDQERITPISANCPKRYGKAEPPLRARVRYNLIELQPEKIARKGPCSYSTMTFHYRASEELHIALLAAREREKTEAFAEQYARRAGIEGTLSHGVRAFDLRQARYLGLGQTHIQHVLRQP